MRKKIDKGMFERMFSIGITLEGIARVFDMPESDVEKWFLETYGITFDEMVEDCRYSVHPNQDKDRPYTVYMHIAPNGKKYIGVTKSTLQKRWDKGRGYHSNEHFTSAIKRYGWDNIQHAILFMRLTRREAEEKEREMIRRFKSNDRRYGYNIEGGGFLRKEVSEETRRKLRENSTGVIPSEETRKKMSDAHKGERCHFYGTHLSDEKKNHLREIKSKAVEQVDDNGVVVGRYPSMKAAAEAFGLTRQAISSCCSGKTKKCAKYYWRWSNGTAS